ncbi:MAG: portal protein, partial [candidate division NC10 bacterium]
MGFKESIAKFFKRDKVAKTSEKGKGYTLDDPAGSAADNISVTGSGMRSLTTQLSMDQQLIHRYADAESMDDYPETCLSGNSLVFTMLDGWVPIRELAERAAPFHVLSYDRELKSIVPAEAHSARKTGDVGHGKPMVRVVVDDGRSITCTADHLFMTKDEAWVAAGDLKREQRLMPGVTRMRPLNTDVSLPYWEVHQPWPDSKVRDPRGKRWTWVHRLVGRFFLGVKRGEVIHHVDGNSLNNNLENLTIESVSSHAKHHISTLDNTKYFPEWTPERRAWMSERMRGNRYKRGTKTPIETRMKMSAASKGRPKSEEHRRNIGMGQPTRINIDPEVLEASLMEGGSIRGAAKILGVSWSTAKRRAEEHDLLDAAANHRVVRVEKLDAREEIFDLTVPKYHNFVCEGLVVHNSAALDIFADDSTIPDSVRGKSIWAESKDKILRDIIDDCLHRRIRIEEDMWLVVRTLCKYGNCFGEVVVTERGVVGVNYLPVPTVRRLVDDKGEIIGYVQDLSGQFTIESADYDSLDKLKEKLKERGMIFFEPWEIVHWRLRSKFIHSLYGYGVLEAARWVWKRLVMLEDSVLQHELTRSPGRFAFYIDTGDLPPDEAMALVKKVMRGYKK